MIYPPELVSWSPQYIFENEIDPDKYTENLSAEFLACKRESNDQTVSYTLGGQPVHTHAKVLEISDIKFVD